jgi:hypothetical protein
MYPQQLICAEKPKKKLRVHKEQENCICHDE